METCSTTAVNTDKDKELATITNRAYQYLECFRLVSSDMRDCFEKISSKEGKLSISSFNVHVFGYDSVVLLLPS